MPSERGWTIGREIGWQIRFERRFSADTRLLVATEGILTARLQQDPLLSAFRTIVLDEFHERSIHADLGLALTREAWRARDDLRIVVMSATMDTDPASLRISTAARSFVSPAGRFPLDVSYAPRHPADAAVELLRESTASAALFSAGRVRRSSKLDREHARARRRHRTASVARFA